jgi:hypothetical protein
MALDEARIKAAIEKIEALDKFCGWILDMDDLDDFKGKWGKKIIAIEPYNKGLYGDDWDEAKNLFNLSKSKREEGATEEEINGALEDYLRDTAEKFKRLAEIASTPAEAAAAEEVAETAEQAAEEVSEEASPEGETGKPGDDPEEEDLSWMDEEDPHEAMIAGHITGVNHE